MGVLSIHTLTLVGCWMFASAQTGNFRQFSMKRNGLSGDVLPEVKSNVQKLERL